MTNPSPPARRIRLVILVAVAAMVFSAPFWLAIAFRAWGFEAFRIPSGSMSPTLLVGDQLFVDKRAGARVPARGDVIVFVYPVDPTKDFISRVVGVAGDRVQARIDGVVEVNGTALPRCELGPWTPPGGGRAFTASLEQNGTHRYAVLYDATRDRTEPSESMHCVDAPCEVPQGHVFTMGDHRDNSYDGRYWGFVPLANVRGRASTVHSPTHDGPSGRRFHDSQAEPVLGPELDAARARCH